EARSAAGFAVVRSTADLSGFDDLVGDSGGTIASGDDIKVEVRRVGQTSSDVSADINLNSNDTIDSIAGKINADTTVNPYVHASVDSNGHLTITSLSEGALIRIKDGTTSAGADGIAFLGLDNVVGTENVNATTRQAGTSVAGRVIESKQSTGTTV